MPAGFRDFLKDSSDEDEIEGLDEFDEEHEMDSGDESTISEIISFDEKLVKDESCSADDDECFYVYENPPNEVEEEINAFTAEKNKPRDHPPAITCEDFIADISFHPGRNLIALADITGDVLMYEYNNEETKLISTLEIHSKACRAVEFDKEGTTMYTTARDKSIILTDVESGKIKQCLEDAHEEPVYSLKCLDVNKIVTGDDEGTVKLWDMRQPDPIFTLNIGYDHISDLITSKAQKYLVCAGGDGVLTSIDLKGRKIYTTSEDYDSEFTCMGLFRSGTKLLTATALGKLYGFNWNEFACHLHEYTGQKRSIQCMVPVTDNIVVTSGEDGILRAAHMFPQRPLGVVGQHSLPVECLDLSYDRRYIASSSHDNYVKFWNIAYFESLDDVINVNLKQHRNRDMSNNLASSNLQNASDFFSDLA